MSGPRSEARRVGSLGLLVPSREDGPYAAATVRSLLAAADAVNIPVSVALVDDGGNGDLANQLPNDPRLVVVANEQHGPGYARTAGAKALAERARQHSHRRPEHPHRRPEPTPRAAGAPAALRGTAAAEVAAGEVAAGEVAAGEVAAGEVAAGEVTAGGVASGGVASGGVASGEAWLVSLDADVTLPATFVADWVAAIEATAADVLVAPAFFGPVGAEQGLVADVETASSWMWGDTSLYEHFVGLVNIGGCNHAVSADVCQANDWYLQPTQLVDGRPAIVPGDDWDFGLRARMAGYTTARVDRPVVTTSVRRIAADPVGFLAGRSYERPFEPIRGAAGATTWPPEEPWDAVARRGRARLVAHFLLKPMLAGIEPAGALEWFLGPPLLAELDKLVAGAPRWDPGGDWNEYRTGLVELCFSDEVFDWCSRAAQHIAGGHS